MKPAFAAILKEEERSLKSIQLKPFVQKVKALADKPGAPAGN